MGEARGAVFIMSDEVVVAQIRAAVNDATRCYLAERRARVAPFTRRHFSFRGALRINRWALGKDLLRTPTNVLWSIPVSYTHLDVYKRQAIHRPPALPIFQGWKSPAASLRLVRAWIPGGSVMRFAHCSPAAATPNTCLLYTSRCV